MDKGIYKRLADLEKRYAKNPLIVLCRTETGEETMTVSECIRRGADFVRVVGGADLADLDLLLSNMKQAAANDVNTP